MLQEFAQEARIEQQVLEELLKRRCSKLLAAFAANDYPLHQVTATWFSHLFCGILPAETTVRVWDSILLEGPKVAFRVAIALLKVRLEFGCSYTAFLISFQLQDKSYAWAAC